MRFPTACAAAGAVAAVLVLGPALPAVPAGPGVRGVPAGSVAVAPTPTAPAAASASAGWGWPLDGFTITAEFVAPAHRYGPGHRGIDLRPRAVGAGAGAGAALHAPAGGVVAFSGMVAGRGVLTIDHGGGLVSTLEPVADALPAGTPVDRGDVVATLGVGGHSAPGTVHLGVRLDGEYINPLLLLESVPRAVLLPCC